ncbi:two pore domain potassium channel family protein [Streptomyces sp. A7024]|uniref:Two pore domain potassium channel family protein n=1 Tax=Streptomyces coryli TaxID=1128680 RepID=A0A6G4TX87_9ACTN|nr:potassium channel family protein [Streptomyces coryli]NGN63657.1 two pore domain potassium channel family protein [Streptomyces coryli]
MDQPPAIPTRLVRWEQRTQRLLLALALVFAVAYAVPIVDPGADASLRSACHAIEWAVWATFAADYAIRVFLAEERLQFIRSHLLDLIVVLLPLIQPLRLLRLVAALILTGRRVRATAQVRVTTYVGGAVVALLVFGSLAVLEVERNAEGASIRTLGDAMWWAFTTMTTVGYGDLAPTTGLGRLLAVSLMISGIALLGLVTANIAAWFIARFEEDNTYEVEQTETLKQLTTEIAALRAEVAALRAQDSPRSGG